jgi:DNA replication and repair protein RecF
MYIKSLYLHNFRLYQEAYFEFSPHLNIICGPNAVGKSSLLEAIHFLGSGRSFRSPQTSHLIRASAAHFYLEAFFVKHGIEQKVRVSYSAAEKKIFFNNTPSSSLSSLYGLLLNVILSPTDLEIISGSPQGRRSFIDEQISQSDPLYLHHLMRYSKAMRQRNHLLKAKILTSIESWEHEMALSAAYILQKRRLLMDQITPPAQELHSWISEESTPLLLSLKASGKPPLDAELVKNSYLELYQKNRYREMAVASTLYGPHRDDMAIFIGDLEARSFASEGQKRSCAAALRLAEWQQLAVRCEEKPVMLIDELGANLDQKRYKKLLYHFENLSQIFVTATEPPPLEELQKEKKFIFL